MSGENQDKQKMKKLPVLPYILTDWLW
jgi:hypothetical protein